jgi:hypothetical protein
MSRFFKETSGDYMKRSLTTKQFMHFVNEFPFKPSDKQKIAHLTAHSLELFLHRLLNDPDKHIDIIYQGLLDSGHSDSARARDALIDNLLGMRCGSIFAIFVAWGQRTRRVVKAALVKGRKELVKKLTNEKISAQTRLTIATESLRYWLELEAAYEKGAEGSAFYNVRSNRNGSRPRTVFMRLASQFFYNPPKSGMTTGLPTWPL